MKQYILVRWKTAPEGEPREFYSELDEERFETRKVEVFAGGILVRADENVHNDNTWLSHVPFPEPAEIEAEDPEDFEAMYISEEQFLLKWNAANDARQR